MCSIMAPTVSLSFLSRHSIVKMYEKYFFTTHIPYGVVLAAFVATSFCAALHMVKLRLYLESVADGRNH